jgi:hypothetical protein
MKRQSKRQAQRERTDFSIKHAPHKLQRRLPEPYEVRSFSLSHGLFAFVCTAAVLMRPNAYAYAYTILNINARQVQALLHSIRCNQISQFGLCKLGQLDLNALYSTRNQCGCTQCCVTDGVASKNSGQTLISLAASLGRDAIVYALLRAVRDLDGTAS